MRVKISVGKFLYLIFKPNIYYRLLLNIWLNLSEVVQLDGKINYILSNSKIKTPVLFTQKSELRAHCSSYLTWFFAW